MRTRLTHLPATLGAALLAVTLTSCSGDPEPIIQPDPSTSAAPFSDPPSSPTATPTPDEPESAKAFIRRWHATNVAMQATGDSSDFRSLGLQCRSCDQIADRVDDVYGHGGAIDAAASKLFAVEEVGRSGAIRVFEFKTRSGPVVITDRTGAPSQKFSGGLEAYQMNLRRVADDWRAVRLTRLNA